MIIEGFNVAGSNQAGKAPEGPNAGIMINGNFVHSSKLAHHIALIGNFVHNHKKWGFHSVDSHSVLMQDNLFALSAMEHSAYVSDGSDNYVIRRNVFFGSAASGLQCNIDATSSLEKLKDHPALEGRRRTSRTASGPSASWPWPPRSSARTPSRTGAGSTSSSKTT